MFFPVCPYGVPDNYTAIVDIVSQEFQVPALLLHSVIWKESRCYMDAIGSQGEIGLMQLHPVIWSHPHNWSLMAEGTGWESFEEAELWDENIRGGAWLLSFWYGASGGSWSLALEWYNGAGPQAREYALEVLKIWESAHADL